MSTLLGKHPTLDDTTIDLKLLLIPQVLLLKHYQTR